MASSSPTAAALDVSDTDLQERPSTSSALDQDHNDDIDLPATPESPSSNTAVPSDQDHNDDTDLPATPESPSSNTAVPSTSRYSLNIFHTH
jgi:hypothetical protein